MGREEVVSAEMTTRAGYQLCQGLMFMTKAHQYKELTLQQLRCFCETARRGSFASAAAALDTSHATVLQHVHALERSFGVKLVEPHERGCAITEPGWLLVELASPVLESVGSLRQNFAATMANLGSNFTIATTPRIFLEDLAPVVAEFCKQSPKTRLTFLEMDDDEIAVAVETRRADFGFTPVPLVEDQTRTLESEECYLLEIRLVGPKDHPLSRQRLIRPRDLIKYPIVNAPREGFSGPNLESMLDQITTGPKVLPQASAAFAASQRELVRLGFGLALLAVATPTAPNPEFFERSLGGRFAKVPVRLIRRRSSHSPPAAEDFMRLVRARLCSDDSARDKHQGCSDNCCGSKNL